MKRQIVKIIYGLLSGLLLTAFSASAVLAQTIPEQSEMEIALPEQDEAEVALFEQDEAEAALTEQEDIEEVLTEQDEAELSLSASTSRLPKTTIFSIENTSGVKLKWKAVSGADGYRVYRRTPGDSWHRIAQVEGKRSYLDTKCVSGVKYAYLVRAYEIEDGKIKVGEAEPAERALILRLDQPHLVKAVPTAEGYVRITWNKVPGAAAYDIYQKSPSTGNWKKIGATKKCTYVMKDLTNGAVGTFAAIARKGEYHSSRGKAKSAVSLVVPKITSAESLDDSIRLQWEKAKGADGYRIYRKAGKGAWERIGSSKTVSYVDKEISYSIAYRYIVQPYRNLNGKKYFGAYTGRYAVSTLFEPPILLTAKKRLEAVGGTLKKAFEWSAFMPYESNQPLAGSSAGYAKWSFEHERGYCYGKASTFCYMARALGYDAWVMEGYVKNGSGGLSDHGWVEIVYDGEIYVCDPSFHGRYAASGYTGYFIKYGQKNTWRYTNYKRMDD